MRQSIKTVLIVLVVSALAMTGVALAQSSDEPVDDGREGYLGEKLAELVAEGVITEDQADAVEQRLTEDGFRFHGMRPGGPGGHGLQRAAGIDDIAEFLDMTPEDLIAELEAGSTLGEIAGDADLAGFLLGALEEQLDAQIEVGRLDENRKAEILAEAAERIEAMINGEFPGPRPGGMGPRGRSHGHGHGHGGPFGPGPGGEDAVDAINA